MAAIIVAGWSFNMMSAPLEGHRPGWLAIAIDVVSLVAVGGLAIHSRRPWVFFVAAANVAILAVHFAFRWLHLGAYAYVTALNLFGGYLPLIGLAFGVWEHRQTKKRAAVTAARVQ